MSNWDELHEKLIKAFEQPKKITEDAADTPPYNYSDIHR